MTKTQATALKPQGYSVFVFNSSGTQSGNRFNSWSDLMTAITKQSGSKLIIFEADYTVPAGTYNLDDVTLKGNGLEYTSGGYTLTFGDNTTISSWVNRKVSDLRILSTSTTGNIVTDSVPVVNNFEALSHCHSTAYPFFKFTGSGQYIIALNNNARWTKLSGGVENVDVTSSAFACQLILSRGKGSAPIANTFKSTNTVIFVDVLSDAAQDATNYPLTNSGLASFGVNVNQVYSTTQNHIPVAKTADFNYTRAAEVYGVSASVAARTGSLPAATGSGVTYTTIKTDNSANTVTVDADGTDTINSAVAWGAGNFVLNAQGNSVTVVDYASGSWFVTAYQ